MKIQLKVLDKEFYSYNKLPDYQTPESAAVDLVCTKDIVLHPGERKLIGTGIAIWIGSHPEEWEWSKNSYAGLILPRSGLGTKGLVLANTVGLIDEDYQGEIMVSAWNNINHIDPGANSHHDHINTINLKAGQRFAQLMFVQIAQCYWKSVDEFSIETERGDGQFGSTGEFE